MNNKNILPSEFYLPCIITLIGVIIGILIFSFTPQLQSRFYINFQIGSIILYLLIIIIHKKRAALFTLSILLGMSGYSSHNYTKSKEMETLKEIRNHEIKMRALVLPFPKTKFGYNYYYLGNAIIFNQHKNIKIKLFKFRLKCTTKFKVNEIVNIKCTINSEYLTTNKYVQLENVKIEKVTPPSSLLHKISNSISSTTLNSIQKIKMPSSRVLIKSLLTGNRTELSETQKNIFRKTGMYHLLALSGLHVLILSSFIHLILKPLPIFPKYKNLIIIIIIWFFYFSVGSPPTLFRAAFAITIFLLSLLFQRKPNSKNALGIAGSLWLLSNPLDLYTASFQLSFLASYTILESLPMLNSLSNKINNKFLHIIFNFIISPTIISIFLLLITTPVLLYHFGILSIGAIFLNIPSLLLVNVSIYLFLIGILLPNFLFSDLIINLSAIIINVLFEMLYFVSHRINLEFLLPPLSNSTIVSLILIFSIIKIKPHLLFYDKMIILLVLLHINYLFCFHENKSKQHTIFLNNNKKQLLIKTKDNITVAYYDILESNNYESRNFVDTWRKQLKKINIDFLIIRNFKSSEDIQILCDNVKINKIIILNELRYYENLQLDYIIQNKDITLLKGYNKKLQFINKSNNTSIFISDEEIKLISKLNNPNKYSLDISTLKQVSPSKNNNIQINHFSSDTCLIRI